LQGITDDRWCAQGLDEQIECVAIGVADKPVWFTEKLYPVGKVPKNT